MSILYGKIVESSYSEGAALMVGDEYLADWLGGFTDEAVYAAYTFGKSLITPDMLPQIAADTANGLVESELSSTYSEVTGFLWVNEGGHIGGHDMIEIFGSHEGEYGILVVQTTPIDYSDYEFIP